jgi:cytochrome c556
MKFLAPLLAALVAAAAAAEDHRHLAPLPAPAQESLRQEMLDNLLAVHEILDHIAAGRLAEAGQMAEAKLGRSAMGKHRDKPMDARPGPNMPPAMHGIGMDGHAAASEFAQAAKAGDRDKALALLPKLTGACVACHYSFRVR